MEVGFSGPLFYTSGCKYQSTEELRVFTRALKEYGDAVCEYLQLSNGLLTIKKGFAWDGASGPTIDTVSSMRAGCVHDAIYRLIRQGALPAAAKGLADKLLHDICLMDGMWHWRANAWYVAVDKLADSAADPKNKVKVKRAPRK